MMSPDCLFCKIVSGDIKAYRLAQNKFTTAFLDIHPLAPGHTVIIPSVHVDSIINLPESMVAPLFLTVKEITATLNAALKPEGFTIGINQGQAGQCGINHLHIHVVPRWLNDKGGSIHAVVRNEPKESLDSIAAKIATITNQSKV